MIPDEDPIVRQIAKLDPKQGDVIVLQLDASYPMHEVWDRLENFRKQAGIEILTVTDDITFYPIKENGRYALVHDTPLSEEQKDRIAKDWVERFPDSRLAFLPGTAQNLVELEDHVEDGLDIL